MKLAILGGHLSPALSIIQNTPKDWEIVFIGRKLVFEGEMSESLEYKTITDLKIPFENLTTGRFQRKFTKKTISSFFKIPGGLVSSVRILSRQKPDAILGFGSYIQFPVVLAAFILRIPVIIHEQTQEAGASNKISSKFAKRICISWETSAKFFPKNKTVFTGIPLRQEVIDASKEKHTRKKTLQIFITGGSSGSHFINSLIESSLENLLKDYKIVHQTGDSRVFKDFDKLTDLSKRLSKKMKDSCSIKKFIKPYEFTQILKNSDLVISRGGINTVYELFVLNKPSIVIPIPFSQRNEQLKNAIFLKDQGLCEVIEQGSASSQILYSKILGMVKNLSNFKRKNDIDLNFDAANKIIEVLKGCVEEK